MGQKPAHKPSIALGELYTLSIGQYYLEQCLKEIKAELQALHGAPLIKSCTQHTLMYVCNNGYCSNKGKQLTNIYKNQVMKISSFAKPKSNQNSKLNLRQREKQSIDKPVAIKKSYQRNIYCLEDYSFDHLSECHDKKQALFLKINLKLSQVSAAIEKIVSRKKARRQQQINPKSIHEVLCVEYNMPKNIIAQDLFQIHRRKLKKKFDNIIADAKRYPGDPKQFLPPYQYGIFYPDTITTNQNAQGLIPQEQYFQQSSSSSQSFDENLEYKPSNELGGKRRRYVPNKKDTPKCPQNKGKRGNKRLSQKQQQNLNRKSQAEYHYQANQKPKKRNKNSITESFDKIQCQNQTAIVIKQDNQINQIRNQSKDKPINLQTPYKNQPPALSSTSRVKQQESDLKQVIPPPQCSINQQYFYRIDIENPPPEGFTNQQQSYSMDIQQPKAQDSQMQQQHSLEYSVEQIYDAQNKAKTLKRIKNSKKQEKKGSPQSGSKDKTKKIVKNQKAAKKGKKIPKEKDTQRSSRRSKRVK